MGAPADGSVFLNSMKLWAMKQAGLVDKYSFDLDLHAEVFEAGKLVERTLAELLERIAVWIAALVEAEA